MANPNDSSFGESQYARLGYFLIASSFLVATFVQLVTAYGTYTVLIHAVAALGSFVAALYTFINSWLAMPNSIAKYLRGKKPSKGQHLHTWIIPLSFLVFWIVAWIEANGCWSLRTVAISVGITLLFFALLIPIQYWRDKNTEKEGTMKVKATCLKCGFVVERDLEIETDTNRFSEALVFLQQQTQEHHHLEVKDSFKWRLGWES
ncbi:hypothetical protein ACFLV2_00565 [Chloroflexota bacterium]